MNTRAIELGWRLRRGTMMGSIFVLGLVAFVVVMSAPILLIGGLAGVLFCGASRWKGSGTAHGTARWATLSDLYRRGLVGGHHGLILGRVGYAAPPSRGQALHALFNAPRDRAEEVCRLVSAAFSNRRRPDPSLIRIKRFVHLATFAPTGRGKSVSVLIPNLLSWHGPVVVTDPKGELFRITGKRRVDRFGHRAICLDPFGAAGGKDSFNPLDLIDPGSRFVIDRARDLANAMIVRTGEEKDPHWNDSAELVLTAFIAFVVCHAEPGERHLQTVRELLTNPEAYRGTIDLMRQSGACAGMLKRLGDQLTRYVEKELASVLTTVNRHLAFLDSPAVADVTGTTSFDPAALLQGRASIYLVLPPDQLRALAGLMRLWVTGLLRFVTMQGESERQPVLFLLDEAGHLGRMQALEDALTLGRGGGVRLWFFFQSLGQLREAFDEKADTFLDNIDTQQFFGLNAISSAEMVSNRLGEATIRITSYQEGRNRSYSDTPGGGTTVQHGSNTSVTHSEMGRKLLKTEEVLQLPEDQAVIFTPGVAPILGTLLRYYEAPEFLPPGKLPRMRLMRKVAAVFLFLLGLAGVIGFALDVSAGPRGPAMPPRQQPAQRP